MTAMQMRLFDAASSQPQGVLVPPPSNAPENQVDAEPTPIKFDTKSILSLEPRERPQATPPAYHQAPPSPEGEVVEIAYYLISFNEIPPDLTKDDLPQRARSCGRRRFIAREGRPLYWRCMRRYAPYCNERIATYDAPKLEEEVVC